MRTGLPISTLSKVENEKLSLSYDKLVRIAERLEVDIALLFACTRAVDPAAVPFGRRSVQRADERKYFETGALAQFLPASELLNKKLVPTIAELRARTLQEFGPLLRHGSEEYAYVLEGACDLHTELYAPLHLERGDSVYFDGAMAHAYLAGAEGRCVVLSVCSAPHGQSRGDTGEASAHRTPSVVRARQPAEA